MGRWSYSKLVAATDERTALALLPYQSGYGEYDPRAETEHLEPPLPALAEVHDEAPALPASTLADLDSEGTTEPTPEWWFRSAAGKVEIPLKIRY